MHLRLCELQQAVDTRRRQGHARCRRLPVEQILTGRAANTSLARAHATATVQFGIDPATALGEGRVGHVFTAADQCVGLGQLFQLWIEGEAPVELRGKGLPACALRPQCAGLLLLANCGMAGDGAFNQGLFAAAKTGALAGSVMIGPAARLPVIDGNCLVCHATPQGLAQLGIGD